LSRDATNYLRKMFNFFKSDNNKLKIEGMAKIFATTEKGIPWNVKEEVPYDNGVIFENWIGLW
jgi:hypothetical protein